MNVSIFSYSHYKARGHNSAQNLSHFYTDSKYFQVKIWVTLHMLTEFCVHFLNATMIYKLECVHSL